MIDRGFVPITDLFGNHRTLRADSRGPRPLDERATLIAYFSKEIDRPAKLIGIRLAHYDLRMLYALQSAFKDRLNRNDRETARKYFWFITKTAKA